MLSRSGINYYDVCIVNLRMDSAISHADNDRTRNELTGCVPWLELDEVEDFLSFLSTCFKFIAQEVGRVGRRRVGDVAVTKALSQMQGIYK